MLVNVHKQKILLLLVMLIFQTTQAQVWTLKQCIDTAQAHNKNLQMSRNNIAMGAQKAKEAQANLIPKVTANADYKYFVNLPYQLMPLSTFNPMAPEGQFKEAQFGVPHNINVNLQLVMPLYNPQIYGAIQATKVASELSELQYQKTEEQVFFEVSNLYYNVQIIHHQRSFMDSNLTNSHKLLQNMRLLEEQLLVKGTDVDKVKLQYEQLQTQKERIKSSYEQTLNALKFYMGVPMNTIVEVETEISFQSDAQYPFHSTIDISLAQTRSRFITTELQALKFSRLPSLNLYGTYGTTGFGFDESPNDFLKFFPVDFVGIQMSVPLFNGTVTQRKINQKKIELQNSELQFELITTQNTMLIENAKRQKILAQKTIVNTGSQIHLAQSIYSQTFLQQKQGLATLTDVLLADNALREAQQAYLLAVVDFLKADLEIRKLTGNIINTIKN